LRIWVTRPEPDASATAALLRDAGYEVWVKPLLEVRTRSLDVDLDRGTQAFVLTSRNGVRALAAAPFADAARRIKCFAVGAATAAELRDQGFTNVLTGSGRAAGLASFVAGHIERQSGGVVHISAECIAHDVVADLQALGAVARRVVAYDVRAAVGADAVDVETVRGAGADAVLLMSVRTAATYLQLVERQSLSEAVNTLRHICLSEAVADSLRLSRITGLNADYAVSPTPDMAGVLTVLGQLGH